MILSSKLVELIEHSADQLSRKFVDLVRTHEFTPGYHTFDQKKLYDRAFVVYSQLGKWLSTETTREEVISVYKELGAQRRREGFALSEVMQALIITKRLLWSKIESEGLLDTALDFNQALELRNQTAQFFDRALVSAARGYEAAAD